MAFGKLWAKDYPPDTGESPTLGAGRIRDIKTMATERLPFIYGFNVNDTETDETQVGAKYLPLQKQAAKPTAKTDFLMAYAKEVSGVLEFFIEMPNGTEIQITTNGVVNGPSQLTTILNAVYPVGCVVTLGVSTNPATLFGIGTWTAIAGKVIVGIDGGQSEFDTLDETGGAKTHTLSLAETPAHTHDIDCNNNSNSGGGSRPFCSIGDNSVTVTTTSKGSGSAHNNLQPYIVKYVWQRTA